MVVTEPVAAEAGEVLAVARVGPVERGRAGRGLVHDAQVLLFTGGPEQGPGKGAGESVAGETMGAPSAIRTRLLRAGNLLPVSRVGRLAIGATP